VIKYCHVCKLAHFADYIIHTFYYMVGCARGQDEPNPDLLLATRFKASCSDLVCSGLHAVFPQEKFSFFEAGLLCFFYYYLARLNSLTNLTNLLLSRVKSNGVSIRKIAT